MDSSITSITLKRLLVAVVSLVAVSAAFAIGYSTDFQAMERAPHAIEVAGSWLAGFLSGDDVGLPGGMNGRQVAEAARSNLPSIKVLFVTGYADHAALSHVHLHNGMHVLTKPFELNAFCQMIQNMMEAKGP